MVSEPWLGEELSVNRAVLQRLRQTILDGTLKPGERLHQQKLAAEYRVSRIPIREALQRLAAEGLVVIRPQRGAFVHSLNPSEIQEAYEMRAALEGMLAGMAIREIGPEGIAEMEAIIERAEALDLDTSDASLWTGLNRDFHLTLYRNAPKPEFIKLIDKYFHQTTATITLYMNLTAKPGKLNAEHRAILEAVRQGDQVAARRLTEEHILGAGFSLVSYFHRPPSSAAAR